MDICSCGHDEIVYNERNCPLCEANEQIEELEKEKGELETNVQTLEERIYELEQEVETLKDIKNSMITIE